MLNAISTVNTAAVQTTPVLKTTTTSASATVPVTPTVITPQPIAITAPLPSADTMRATFITGTNSQIAAVAAPLPAPMPMPISAPITAATPIAMPISAPAPAPTPVAAPTPAPVPAPTGTPAKQQSTADMLKERLERLYIQGITAKFPLTEAERQAFTTLRNMLEPDKLGGTDRTFRFSDLAFVMQGLRFDADLVLQEAHNQVDATRPGLGNRLGHRFVNNYGRGRGLGQNIVGQQVAQGMAQKRVEIEASLTQMLKDSGVKDDRDGSPVTSTARNVTTRDLLALQQAGEIIKAYQKRAGLVATAPDGIKQSQIDLLLSGGR